MLCRIKDLLKKISLIVMMHVILNTLGEIKITQYL